MSKWRATLKRKDILPGTAQFVLGVKLDDGSRFELDGVIHKDVLEDVFKRLTETNNINNVEGD